MRTLTLTAAVAAAILGSAGACKKKDKAPPAPAPTANAGTGSAAPTPTPTPTANPDTPAPVPTAVDPAMSNKAGNCPAAVAGAKAELVDGQGAGVVLAITAADAPAVDTIRSRAKHLAAVQDAPDAQVKHGGEGTGGGAGMCPVITTRDVKVAVAEVPGGVHVTMTPTGAMTPADLAREVATRIDKMGSYADFAKGGGGGAGGGAGDHGGNHSGQGDGKGKDRDAAKPALGGT